MPWRNKNQNKKFTQPLLYVSEFATCSKKLKILGGKHRRSGKNGPWWKSGYA